MDFTRHNYYRKVMSMVAAGELKKGDLAVVDIYHDEWCGINRGTYCNCNPDIKLSKRRKDRRPNPSDN
jgi:hypothetical protein